IAISYFPLSRFPIPFSVILHEETALQFFPFEDAAFLLGEVLLLLSVSLKAHWGGDYVGGYVFQHLPSRLAYSRYGTHNQANYRSGLLLVPYISLYPLH